MTTTTSTDDTTQPLPAGHDDPASLTYVPEHLRPYFAPQPLDRVDQRDAVDDYGNDAWRDVMWQDPDVRAAWFAHDRYAPRDRKPLAGQLAAALGKGRSSAPLTPAMEDRAVHLWQLARAAAVWQAVERDRVMAERDAASRCPACGTPRVATRVLRGAPGVNPDADETLCPPCRSVAAMVRVERMGSQPLDDGTSRRDAVARWMAT